MPPPNLVLAEAYDVALLDLDGVVYVGEHAVPHAEKALAQAREAGMRLAFVTNNAARSPEQVARHLRRLGIAAEASEVVTSAQAAARVLTDMVPPGSPVLVVGGEGLDEALVAAGLRPVSSMADEPAAVVQGFHPDISWHQLAEGAYALAAGLPWVATNVDPTIPTPRGIAPGNGALVDLLGQVSGREPIVAGKPEPPMHRETLVRSGARRPLVVGDRLDTDIEGANRVGVDSLIVLTGVTDPVEIVCAPPGLRPTFVGADLRALLSRVDESVATPGRTRCGAWQASVSAGKLVLEAGGQPVAARSVDAIRAACGAVWSQETRPAGVDDALAQVAGLR